MRRAGAVAVAVLAIATALTGCSRGGMFLSRGTVRNALARIYRRFGVHSQSGLVVAILTGQSPATAAKTS